MSSRTTIIPSIANVKTELETASSEKIPDVQPNREPVGDKTVILTYSNGNWDADIKVNNPASFFTERDWNIITRLLTSKRALMRQKAFVEYSAATKKQASLITSPVKS